MNFKRIALGLGISLFFIYLTLWAPNIRDLLRGECSLYYALFGRARLDFSHIWDTIMEMRLFPLILAFLLNLIQLYVRGHRWSVLIQPNGKLKTSDGVSIHLIGYLANAVLPLKAGEVIRVILVANRLQISSSTALATVVLERMVDLLSLLFIIGFIYFVFPIPQPFTKVALIIGIVSIVAFAILFYLATFKKPISEKTEKELDKNILGRKLKIFLARFIDGFMVLRSTHHLGIILFETIILYVLYMLQMYFLLYSFNFTTTYPLIMASPIVASIVLLVIDSIAIAIPSAPSAVGTFHAISILGLSLFDIPTDPAAGFAIVQHALIVIFSITFGLAAMWHSGMKIHDLSRLQKEQKNN